MESLVPPFVYNDYVKALGDGNLDDCYKILNSVFGKISTEEAAYLAAYKIRDRLNGKHQRGVLFVDVLSGKTFFMEQRRRDSGEKGGKNRILLVPNGFLNLYKFFGYSLYLVDLMVSTSSYASEIRAVESALIGGKTFKGANVTINVESRELPVCKILTYKYFVYTVFSMEVCGLPSTTIKKTIAALREKMFEVQNSVILIRKEVDILGYLNVVVLSNKK
ncbi:hypothetical protein ECANGB1_135 [Enterospora canceri]|uniref:Uncharacterized protein n=1 Tax=Enterospora canceri TaxID=1081671 RepID=A0A1Y1S898_9MICR|nr:hypothetical protein ECANGB1_135 [Enterospora canceri]